MSGSKMVQTNKQTDTNIQHERDAVRWCHVLSGARVSICQFKLSFKLTAPTLSVMCIASD